ncbi:hydroxyproline-rich glycoprotein family protein [Striga hermonthica]|uniref:Hydroxyproline-rich glycoprotein family protein n=1 Tax=Striga hermonthica TaxID=68872 RepID=A0A9N7RBP0_STRHE|nr:hydroxyproline-rich glycoprotein family protein [Striga hermonthica]
MADTVSHKPEPRKHSPTDPENDPSSKFYRHFLFKSSLITVLILLLSLFPSIAPEFISRTLHAASWELLRLIFIGIAVSYGLFSRKNEQMEKPESPRVVTLNSRYFRVEPVVMVAKQQITNENKPLLLPVRSLKPKPRNVDDMAVLRSPIPWMSRSRRTETNENEDIKTNPVDGLKFNSSSPNHKKLTQSKSSSCFAANDDVAKFLGVIETSDEDNVGNNIDVDKKADEFIAKFREQIRLQRIESIRRSSAQFGGKAFD